MGTKRNMVTILAVLATVLLAAYLDNGYLHLLVPLAFAHCDTMGGPVIKDAQKALETGKVDPVLKWIKPGDEDAIRKAFEKTREVRKLNSKARELADMYFFETLVRIHRADEGAPYEGIKPAGSEVEPGIEAADKAVETGNGEALVKDVSDHIAKTVRERFTLVMEKKKQMNESATAGREYVKAYVTFIHYVEKLHQLASGAGLHHADESGAKPPAHQH